MLSFGCLYQQVLCRIEVGVGWKLMGKEIGLSVPEMCLQLSSACCFFHISSASIRQTHQLIFSPCHEWTEVSCIVVIRKGSPVGWFDFLFSCLLLFPPICISLILRNNILLSSVPCGHVYNEDSISNVLYSWIWGSLISAALLLDSMTLAKAIICLLALTSSSEQRG